MSDKYLNFKSGSDIRGFGIADESEPLYLSDEKVMWFTLSFLKWLCQKTSVKADQLTVSVGHDSRLSAHRIKTAVISALLHNGVNVIDCGMESTPAMFMTTVKLNVDAAIQITASHHPMDKNGLKFFTKDGGLDGSDIEWILLNVTEENIPLIPSPDNVVKQHFLQIYSDILRKKICKGTGIYNEPLKGLKIVVDAGNGAGGFFADQVLAPLGADVSASQFLEPDGNFPNHIPNPENAEAMRSVCDAVKNSNADFGIIFDTDVDRAACVGKNGYQINRNRLIALASSIVLDEHKGATVVTDSVTSDGLSKFIEAHGGVHLRYKRGYRNVINKQIELISNGIDCPLAIETSGHAAFSENYFLDDGAYLITKIIIKLVNLRNQNIDLEDFISNLEEAVEERELRFDIKVKDFKSYGETVIEKLKDYVKHCGGWSLADNSYEGVRISADTDNGNGWALLRLSVHDPVMPLNVESLEKSGADKILRRLKAFLADFDGLDLSDFNKYGV
ncbi:MAG: phosphomannomutase/phosphoglucomutase [Clostridiales bacterium]|nr:phosphomannomutase/phosphoglucomutase [Clostridiales bacterium]